MGYLKQGKVPAFFSRLSDQDLPELNRLLYIFKKTKNNRIKTKIAKRIDGLVKVDA